METKKILMSVLAVIMCFIGAKCVNNYNNEQNNTDMSKKILFINGSPNKNGNTANLAKILLKGYDYESLNLCDYRINFYGQSIDGDRFEEILIKMKNVDVIVIGSPVYWHNICASVRTIMERFYGNVSSETLLGKDLFFIYQGEAPTKMMIDDGEYTMSRFAKLYGLNYKGMINSENQAKTMNDKLK